MSKRVILGLLLISTSVAASASGPYAGQQQRAVKSLSAQETQDLLDGKGAGLAKTAELNHFPGPAHVLELADALQLTALQKKQTQEIFARMQHDARTLGKTLVEQERELDRLFASGAIDKATLRTRLDVIGRLHTDVRRTHLQAHLEQRALLTPKQIAAYDRMRGYGDGQSSTHAHPSHHR